jgi:hypothetical protein
VICLVGLLVLLPAARAEVPPDPVVDVSAPPAAPGPIEAPLIADNTAAYVDSAIPRTLWRLRADSAGAADRPTRAEFFWPRGGLPGNPGPGPHLPEVRVDYQEYTSYLECLITPELSGFVEGGMRTVNPAINENETGMGDMNAGFKWAFLALDDTVATFQMRTYIPTGPHHLGLGTGHVSLEPALLFSHRPFELLSLEGEVRYWAPIGGTDFAGDVLRYGLALSFGRHCEEGVWLRPVVEFVGWTVLGGKELAVLAPGNMAVQNASGDTIVNVSAGVRIGVDRLVDFYIGYTRGITGSVWYRDNVRVEFRWLF